MAQSGSSGQLASDASQLGLRERGKRRRTERILDAGLQLLREDPDANLTVERIAARAEVSPMTVFNLVGNRDELWSAMADRALESLDLDSISADDPQERARRIMDAVVRVLRNDAVVFRGLLSGWRLPGIVIEHDPTSALIECLEEAAVRGQIRSDLDLRRYGEVMAAGLIGTIHQWIAGLLNDRAFRSRARAVIDIVFAGAR